MQFIAIGVAQGDAFFLEREEGFTALVDGGRSASGFPSQFQRVTKCDGVDVLVCTHNDADHANGIIGFLEAGLRCNEVWLPASWTDRLEDLLLRPGDFIGELVENVQPPDEGIRRNRETERVSLEQLGDVRSGEGPSDEPREPVELDALLTRTLEATSEDDTGPRPWLYPLASPFRLDSELFRHWLPDNQRFRLFLEAIEAGERIRRIATLAYDRGCQIRWFEYTNSGASGGEQGKLVPVNAQEVFKVRVRRWSSLVFLALTVANRQSLVFSAPANDCPSALFTADSDLHFANTVPWQDGMIITAPHHGSEANAKAYGRFQREAPATHSSIWVRSDGRYKSRPGRSYLSLNAARFCTLCRGSLQPKQDLLFSSSNQKWQPVATRGCACE